MNYRKVRPTNKPRAIAQLMILPLSAVVSVAYAFVQALICFFIAAAQQLQSSYEEYMHSILDSFGYEEAKPF
jgi:hypothetical protein